MAALYVLPEQPPDTDLFRAIYRYLACFPSYPLSRICLKYSSDEKGGAGSEVILEEETEDIVSEKDPFIRCGQCLNGITHPEEKISVGGAHQHTFANPNGIVFEIGCFRSAAGCKYAGAPTDEFTWFKGYAWRIAVCGRCLLHLGWLYLSGDKKSFAGLIVDRLVYPE